MSMRALHLLRYHRNVPWRQIGSGMARCSTWAEEAGDQEHQHPGVKYAPSSGSIDFWGGPGNDRPTPVPIPCFRTLSANGQPLEQAESAASALGDETALQVYEAMVKLQVADVLFYEAQRQGRLSFYATSFGEEAATVGSAAALEIQDSAFLQYRELGVLLWRGFSLRQMADQCYGNMLESGKGRQMPIHYGSAELNVHTVASTLATQIPHAVGAGFAHKVKGQKSIAIVYFGDGATSEGDFHAAMNFAATLSIPVIFFCRNNGYAISTPVSEQFRGDGVACRGPPYGMASIRVDGSDARAVYCATKKAREVAVEECRPVLIEALCYRGGHHSTSDDSSRYREESEMQFWQSREPLQRFRQWLYHKELWDEGKEKELRKDIRSQVITALDEAQKVPKAPASEILTDVYASTPWHLEEQRNELLDFLHANPTQCPSDIPLE